MTTAAEAGFLATIKAEPAEDTHRLVYADWLDDAGRANEACRQRLAVAMRAVRANPADDAPRLRYAEVCDQYGDARRGVLDLGMWADQAAFIRTQIELAAGPRCERPRAEEVREDDRYAPAPRNYLYHPCGKCPKCRRHQSLPGLATDLASRGVWAWLREAYPGCPDLVFSRFRFLEPHDGRRGLVVECKDTEDVVTWRRGFVERVDVTGARWERDGDAILDAQPVTEVRFTDGGPVVEVLSDPGRWFRYRVGGRVVGLAPAEMPDPVTTPAVARHLLSKRWPQVPTDGWMFGREGTGIDWAAGPADPLDDMRNLRDYLFRQAVRSVGIPPDLADLPPQPELREYDDRISRLRESLLTHLRMRGPTPESDGHERRLRDAIAHFETLRLEAYQDIAARVRRHRYRDGTSGISQTDWDYVARELNIPAPPG